MRKVRITPPSSTMKYGGNRSDSFNQLDTSWSQGTYAGAPGVMPDPNPYGRTGRTLPEVPDEHAGGPNVINAEKDEQVLGQFTADGLPSLMSVDGPPHTHGGKNVSVPDNSFVFSDTQSLKIKNPEILKLFNETKGKTPAGIAKKYDLSKYTKVIADPNTDNISKKTAQMMVNNMTGKLNQLVEVQEGMKAAKGLDNNHQVPQPPMQQYGGISQYAGGGYRFDQDNGNQTNQIPYVNNFIPDDYHFSAKRPVQPMGNPYMPYVNSFPQDVQRIDTTIPGMNIPTPQPTNMQTVNIPNGLGNMTSTTITDNSDRTPFGVPTPDKLGIADSLLNLASIHRYQPWEAPIGAVLPQTTYLDPTRALAANSEIANSLSSNNALSGNSRAARASNMALQGEAGKSAADIVGNYANQNTQIANRSSEQATEIMNRLQSMQAERSNRLYQGNVTAAQQYDNATRQGRNDLTNQLQQAWKDRQAYDDINQTNQYYYRDPKSGRITFRPGMDRVAYNQITSGRGAGNFNSPEQIAEYYKSHGITDEKLIADVQDDWIREHQLDLRNRTKTTTKSGNTTTQSTSYNKFGGYTNKLKKFTK